MQFLNSYWIKLLGLHRDEQIGESNQGLTESIIDSVLSILLKR